jgi:hypothetical protein
VLATTNAAEFNLSDTCTFCWMQAVSSASTDLRRKCANKLFCSRYFEFQKPPGCWSRKLAPTEINLTGIKRPGGQFHSGVGPGAQTQGLAIGGAQTDCGQAWGRPQWPRKQPALLLMYPRRRVFWGQALFELYVKILTINKKQLKTIPDIAGVPSRGPLIQALLLLQIHTDKSTPD